MSADDTSITIAYKFNGRKTIPIKVPVLDRAGAILTNMAPITVAVSVIDDRDCDGNVATNGSEQVIATSYNSQGLTQGMMVYHADTSLFQYNLNTKSLPDGQCFIIRVTATSTGACQSHYSERVLLSRTK